MKITISLCLFLQVAFGSPILEESLTAVAFGEGRIIGGQDARPNAYPYQISLQYSSNGGVKKHRCGGSVLSATKILTAAHCVDTVKPNQLAVVAGAHNMKVLEPTQQRRDVASFAVHPSWNSRNINNDIAVLTLSEPLELNDVVKVISIAPQGIEPSGPALGTGWGLTENGGSVPPDALQEVQLKVFPRSRCQLIYSIINPINKTMMCANSPGEHKGACNGDSGSPLVCNNGGGSGSDYQCGVVSWGVRGQCGNPNFPSVYANVANYHNWINAQL
jgi:secreted trypsin-like serine protease